jgi:hypothetical protein
LGAAAGCRGAGSGGACGPGRRRPWEIRGEEERLECDARVCFCDRSVGGRASHLGAWPVVWAGPDEQPKTNTLMMSI